MNRAGSSSSSRVFIVVLLVGSIVLAGVARQWAINRRVAAGDGGVRTNVAAMNSFAIALLLGGLRAPLVMILWAQSETAKQQRDIQVLDTQIELIRLLQPEFDSVHIFQVWNKAYNISVQMASLDNKYTTILDAIEYANRVTRERPDNINMVYEIGSLYTRKLGDSMESEYYKQRVRQETLPHSVERQKLSREDPGWRPLQHRQMLDDRGYILPEFKTPPPGRTPGSGAPDDLVNDGSELQYLKPYEPFPDGLSAHALGYNYHRQAQALSRAGVMHAQMTPRVIEGRVRATLRLWAAEELTRSRNAERIALGAPQMHDVRDIHIVSATIRPDAPIADREQFDRAIRSYDLCARLAADTVETHKILELQYPDPTSLWTSQVEDVDAMMNMALGDKYFLQLFRDGATSGADADRAQTIKQAIEHYRASKRRNQRTMLRYFTPDAAVAAVTPNASGAIGVSDIPNDQLDRAVEVALGIANGMSNLSDPNREARDDYGYQIERADLRLAILQSLDQDPASTRPVAAQ